MKGIGFVSSIVIFNVFGLLHCMGPETFVGVIAQNMVLASRSQLAKGEIVKVVVDDHIIKVIGNMEGESKPLVPLSWNHFT